MNNILCEGDSNCIWKLRMSTSVFVYLCDLLHHKKKKNHSIQVRFRIFDEIIYRYFNYILYLLLCYQDVLLVKPELVFKNYT